MRPLEGSFCIVVPAVCHSLLQMGILGLGKCCFRHWLKFGSQIGRGNAASEIPMSLPLLQWRGFHGSLLMHPRKPCAPLPYDGRLGFHSGAGRSAASGLQATTPMLIPAVGIIVEALLIPFGRQIGL